MLVVSCWRSWHVQRHTRHLRFQTVHLVHLHDLVAVQGLRALVLAGSGQRIVLHFVGLQGAQVLTNLQYHAVYITSCQNKSILVVSRSCA